MTRRFFIAAVLATVAFATVSAKKPRDPAQFLLDKAVKTHGGMAKFSRIESLSFDFSEIPRSLEEGSPARGRRLYRLHDEKGLRARQEIELEGEKTVFILNAGAEDGAQLRQNFNLLFLPFVLKESSCAVQYNGLGRLEGRLLSRLSVTGPQCLGFSADDALTVYIDSGTFEVRGFSREPGPGTAAEQFVLTDHMDVSGLLIPSAQILLDQKGEAEALIKIHNIAINSYIDENLFHTSAGGPQ